MENDLEIMVMYTDHPSDDEEAQVITNIQGVARKKPDYFFYSGMASTSQMNVVRGRVTCYPLHHLLEFQRSASLISAVAFIRSGSCSYALLKKC